MRPTRAKRPLRLAARLQREWDANPVPVPKSSDAATVALARRLGKLAGYSRTTSSRSKRARRLGEGGRRG